MYRFIKKLIKILKFVIFYFFEKCNICKCDVKTQDVTLSQEIKINFETFF